MNGSGKKVLLVLSSLVLIVLLVITSCTTAPAEEKPEVVIGLLTGFTGSIPETTAPLSEAWIDCIKYTNERGGIAGAEIKTVWYETGGNVPKHVTLTRQLIEEGAVVTMTCFSSGGEVIAPIAVKEKVPTIFIAGLTQGQWMQGTKWAFGGGPAWNSDSALFLNWFQKEKWTETRPMRVGSIIYDFASGWDMIRGFPEWCEQNNIEWLGTEVVPPVGCLSADTEYLRLKDKGMDVMVGGAAGPAGINILKAHGRYGEGIVLDSSYWIIQENMIGITGEAIEGAYTQSPYAYTTDIERNEGVKPVAEVAMKNRGYKFEEIPGNYFGGWAHAQVVIGAVEQAIKEVGLENLTGSAVRDALASMNNFVGDPPLIPPVTMSDEFPSFVKYENIYQVREGAIQYVTGPIEMPIVEPFE